MTASAAKAEHGLIVQAFSVLFSLCVLFVVWPLEATRYLPIEDLPQHLAAIRVLHSFDDASFGFQQYFVLALRQTQYLGYYLLADGLAYFVDLERANHFLVVLTAAAIPYALLYLLDALNRDRVLALFALPLTYNAHLILGFINFLMAISAALVGLGLVVHQCRSTTRGRALALGLTATFCFFCHVVPFAFLVLGAFLLCVQLSVRRTAYILSPLLPALLVGAAWMAQSPAGQATLSAAAGGDTGLRAVYQPADVALRDLPNWLTDVFHGPAGLRQLEYFGALLSVTLLLGLMRGLYMQSWRSRAGEQSLWAPGSFVRLVPLVPLAAAAYFVLPSGYAWIWPIAQRFPLMCLLLLVPVLPKPPRVVLAVIVVGLLWLSATQQRAASSAFAAFEQEEVGAFDQALAAIPNGQRVMGLIYARGSKQVKFSPFIHFVAFYQARKGGAVMFTFADFPQSPFRFREDARPPRVPPRWEWMPERVRPADIGWYDYVLVRGGAGDPCRGACELRFRQGFWSVWKRRV
ncbi:MAG TPA: hypothetical protein VFN67_22405 [Polyangiales bacterium]|nr:hypothetical protein [Polyangiales bacterium]